MRYGHILRFPHKLDFADTIIPRGVLFLIKIIKCSAFSKN